MMLDMMLARVRPASQHWLYKDLSAACIEPELDEKKICVVNMAEPAGGNRCLPQNLKGLCTQLLCLRPPLVLVNRIRVNK